MEQKGAEGPGMEDLLPGWRTPEGNGSHGLPETSKPCRKRHWGFINLLESLGRTDKQKTNKQ